MTHSKTVPCLCSDAGAHPDGDTVTFKEQIGFRELATAERSIGFWRLEGATEAGEIIARLSEFYLLHFIEKWTLTGPDDKGKIKPLPVSKDNVRERVLSNVTVALDLAEFADSLYTEVVFLPLAARVSGSSPTSPTNGLTSVNGRTGKNGRHSKRSSTSTSLTAATVTMP